jgi:hypothetical protein
MKTFGIYLIVTEGKSPGRTRVSGQKKVADRLPLSGPPLAFFVTPNLPLSGRIEPQRKTLRTKRSSILLFVKPTIHF